MGGPGRLRLFWALPVRDDLRAALASWQAEARRALPEASWARPEGFHLTLAFLGGRPPSEVEPILSAGRAVASGQGPFTLRTAGMGAFPDLVRARVICLRVESEACSILARNLQEAMASFGATLDRTFRPHITLGRPRRPLPFPALPAPFPDLDFPADGLVLFESRTEPGGARYTELGRAGFKDSRPPGP
ncbi:MAG: RNA 2',3'-cyclic phosphodiesterase [Acidobacteria bacterium]|nr:RNA 2',3'-cyclic phosphodiesterase [Acidobacteriota bacterium]